MDAVGLARDLEAAASRSDQRRLLVLAGSDDGPLQAAAAVLEALDADPERTTVLGPEAVGAAAHLSQREAAELLGTTRDAVVLDGRATLRPNALGRVVGTVDGGGLLVLLVPPLEQWPDRSGGFEEGLAVPPYDVEDVGGAFRRRLVETLRVHDGVAIYDVDAGTVIDDGATGGTAATACDARSERPSGGSAIPAAAYDACLTQDQTAALAALEALWSGPSAVVLEADRGRGKSSAVGLAAASLAADGQEVLVTAPGRPNAATVFERAGDLLEVLGSLDRDHDLDLTATGGGSVRYRPPVEAAAAAADADVLLVDEAAAIPVHVLADLLAADRIAFATTIHGYEGAGRGFSVRFRDHLADARHEVSEVELSTPIRYARGDPVETWAFRALLLDARPAVDQVVADATPETATYRRPDAEELLDDEHLLREAFGLLVLAHYRTEPNDLARLLDAPNLAVRLLADRGHVVAVALVAEEGGLPADRRAEIYEGGRIRGHMLPDVLTSQLRDEDAGAPEGRRIVRIATHPAVRSRGLGSALLERIHAEFGDAVDWFGTGYGATPALLSFWGANGYHTVHLSTTRNDESGEYSGIMLRRASTAGEALLERHDRWFRERIAGTLSDSLDDVDPDVVRGALATTAGASSPDLTGREWRVIAGAATGPGLFDTAPHPFRALAVAHLTDGAVDLAAREERLLVAKVLQGRPWSAVADALGYPSTRQCMRALGSACEPLVEHYGDADAVATLERFR